SVTATRLSLGAWSLGGAFAGLAQILKDLGVQTGAGLRGLWQLALGAGWNIQVGEQVRGAGVRLNWLWDTEVKRLVDQGPTWHVIPVHKGHRGALVARAA